jgi:hypothetical protein
LPCLLVFAQGAILLWTMKMLRPPDMPGVPLPSQITPFRRGRCPA